jgi:hypothetical protein
MKQWEYCLLINTGNDVVIIFYLQTGETVRVIKRAKGEKQEQVLGKAIFDLGRAGWEAYSAGEGQWHFKRQLPP